MTDRKSKMVSFRLSPDEYRQLRNACTTRGLRSVSELARAAMQSMIGIDTDGAPRPGQIDDLRRRVVQLAHEIERLSAKVPQNGDRAQ